MGLFGLRRSTEELFNSLPLISLRFIQTRTKTVETTLRCCDAESDEDMPAIDEDPPLTAAPDDGDDDSPLAPPPDDSLFRAVGGWGEVVSDWSNTRIGPAEPVSCAGRQACNSWPHSERRGEVKLDVLRASKWVELCCQASL